MENDRLNITTISKLPPHNLEAECSVLGALLLSPTDCDKVFPILKPEDFFRDANRRIYKHLIEMSNENIPIDLTLLRERLSRFDEMDAIGGDAYLGQLMQDVHVIGHLMYYTNIVHEKSGLRKIINIGSQMVEDAFAATATYREVITKAEQSIFNFVESETNNRVFDAHDTAENLSNYLDAKLRKKDNLLMTGFHRVDEILDGLHPSQLIVIAARVSMGKTALVTNILEHVAIDLQKTVLFVSLEMSNVEIGLRLLQSRGLIDAEKIKKVEKLNGERPKVLKTITEIAQGQFFIDETSSRTVTEISSLARRYKRKHDLSLLIVDYIGLVTPENTREQRNEQVARIARQLKTLARELKIPVICLAQLNREAENTDRPRLSHLKESGAIEQDADVVMFIYREEQGMKKEEAQEKGVEGKATIIVAKNRNGECADVQLNWLGQYTRFENPTYHDDNEPTLYDVRNF
jgi:replicative DNA helicase